MADGEGWDRRSVLRGAAVVAGAAAAVPLLGGVAAARTGTDDADALFKAGKFAQAARAYEEILTTDPANLQAARRRGYIALLSNRFAEAEKYLATALELAPDDRDTNQYLGDCYIRQDKLSLSVPRWKAGGRDLYATWFAAVSGAPYRIDGDIARLPWLQMDPEPLVEVSVNGGPAKRFMFYTGEPFLGLSTDVAKEAGLSAVAQQEIKYLDGTKVQYFGVLESIRLGDIELRNVPVEWSDPDPATPGGPSDGMIGTWVFYHFLTTFDYPGRSLILRRRTPETAERVRTAAERAGATTLPLWLAREHMMHSRGTVAGATGSGPRVMGVNVGGTGEAVAGMHGPTAEQLRIRTDTGRPLETFAHSQPATTFPCYPREVRLGNAVAKDAYCESNPDMPLTPPYGFDVPAHVGHCFFKPYNVTADFTAMNLHLAPGKAG